MPARGPRPVASGKLPPLFQPGTECWCPCRRCYDLSRLEPREGAGTLTLIAASPATERAHPRRTLTPLLRDICAHSFPTFDPEAGRLSSRPRGFHRDLRRRGVCPLNCRVPGTGRCSWHGPTANSDGSHEVGLRPRRRSRAQQGWPPDVPRAQGDGLMQRQFKNPEA